MLLFYKFFSTLIGCFRKNNIIWHFLAISLTFVLVASGFDWFYYKETRNALLGTVLFPAIIIGGLLPMIGLPLLLIIAKIKKNIIIEVTVWTLGQAALIGWCISSLYKAFTGRAHPIVSGITNDITRIFHFGFLQEGIFWGWPSSHTTVAFAMAFALAALYPKNISLRYASYSYALYVGVGVSISIHWFSDFVAGAIIGAVIGSVVGRSFYNSSNFNQKIQSKVIHS